MFETTSSFEHKGKRLDLFLANSSEFEAIIGTKLSRSHIVRGIRNGGVRIQKTEIKPSFTLSAHETFAIFPEKFEEKNETLLPEPNLPITVIKETPDFLIIDKPVGIQVHPSVTRESGTIANWIIAHYPEIRTVGEPDRPGIVHRLDRDTSGILIIARTKKSFTALKRLFKDRKINKRYLALIFGSPKEKEGTITAPIARSTRGDRQAAATEGKRVKGIIRPAETSYRVLKTFGDASLVEVEPHTGRTHQIRVHLATIGHPVLGDTLYGSKASKEASLHIPRHLLHAARLEFTLFKKEYSFATPLPQDFEETRTLYKSRHSE